jgi:Lrp/AsnC family leucine-responsive transcriptional regulator
MPGPLEEPIDRVIAAELVKDGRSTLKMLGSATGLSVSAVQARVRRLEAEGVIGGYTARIDPEALGLPLAAFIALSPQDPDREYQIPDTLAEMTEIESCHSVAGEASFMLYVRVASPLALEELIREIRRRTKAATRTTVVLQTFYDERRQLPPK